MMCNVHQGKASHYNRGRKARAFATQGKAKNLEIDKHKVQRFLAVVWCEDKVVVYLDARAAEKKELEQEPEPPAVDELECKKVQEEAWKRDPCRLQNAESKGINVVKGNVSPDC